MNLERIVSNALADALQAQPWWKRYANTVVAALTMTGTFLAWLLMSWADAPGIAKTILGIAAVIVGVLVQRLTPNGVTPRGNQTLQDKVAAELEHYDVQQKVRDVVTDFADPIAAAVERGFSEHDPRYIGMTTIAAARAYLANLGPR